MVIPEKAMAPHSSTLAWKIYQLRWWQWQQQQGPQVLEVLEKGTFSPVRGTVVPGRQDELLLLLISPWSPITWPRRQVLTWEV